jgi:putative ABC transport system permease protein
MTLREWITRLRSTFRPNRRDPDLEEELRLHVELATEEAQRRGQSREQAARAATLLFGGVAQSMEAMRDQRGLRWLEDLGRDLRYAARGLSKHRGFAFVAILSLALGIGANTAVFSLVNTLMLRKLPVRAPEQLVELLSHYPGDPRINVWSFGSYETFRDRNHVFSDVVGLSPTALQAGTTAGDVEPVNAAYVVGPFFPALGIQPAMGRLIGQQDNGPGEAPVAVVSASYWRTRLNGDRSIVGRRILLNRVPTIVVGVTPPAFFGLLVGFKTDVWLPVAAAGLIEPTRPVGSFPGDVQSRLNFALIGRLRPGVSLAQARAEMGILDEARIADLAARDPRWRQATLDVEPAAAGLAVLRDSFGSPLLVLMAMVGLLLSIACTNIASLLLARGAARRREMAVRVALGAGRVRLVRQVLTEALLLSVSGTALGAGLAYAGVRALVTILASGRLGPGDPVRIEVQPDLHVLLFTVGIALLTGMLFGLAPMTDVLASAPASSLGERVTTSETRSRRAFGRGLVVAQVAFSLVLLTCAGLFVRHVSNLRSTDLGFQRDGVLLVTLDPRSSGYGRAALSSRYRDLLERFESIPGVRSATLSGTTPIAGGAASAFATVEGFQEPPDERQRVMLNWVGPRYFETFGTQVLAGRDFQFEDANRSHVAIVNRAFVRRYFGVRNPIGQQVTLEFDRQPYEIVGIVADAKYADLHSAAPRTIYLNAFQGQVPSQFALRTTGAPTAVVSDVRRAVRDIASNVSVSRVTTLTDQIDASIVMERLIAALSGWFGALGASLVAVGLYGLLAYTVARRVHEIGVRLALGATPRDMTRMVLRSAAGLVGAGLVVGIPVAIWAQRLARALIEGLPAGPVFPIAESALAMMAVALLAAAVPAWRAARVQPADALRHE